MKMMHKEWIKAVAFFAIAFSGWLLPAPAPLTEIGVKTLTVFAAAVFGWAVTGDIWPSFFATLLFPLTGIHTLKSFLAVGWGSDTMVFMITAFTLVAFLEATGVSQFTAAWLLKRPFLKGHPWRIVLMLFFIAFLICCVVNLFIGMFVTWEIIYNITKIVGKKPYDKLPTLLILGVALVAALNVGTLPWHGNAIVNLGILANMTGEQPNFLEYVGLSLPYALGCIVVYTLLCKFVFRLDVSPLMQIDDSLISEKDLVLTYEKKLALYASLGFVVLLLAPSFFPKGSAAVKLYHAYGAPGLAILFIAIMALVAHHGERVFEFGKLTTKGTPWNMVMMVSVILALGPTLTNEKTGLVPFLETHFLPVLQSLPGALAVVALLVVAFILTNLLVNMVVVALLLPVVLPMAANIGYNPTLLAFTLMLTTSLAILTPAAGPAASLSFPNKKWLRTKDIYKYMTPALVACLIWLVVCFYLYQAVVG